MITTSDIVFVPLTKEELDYCIDTSQHLAGYIVDRVDLHQRDELERFNNILMGEVAEQMVIKWLRSEGKTAESAVDKLSNQPDFGHDIRLIKKNETEALCSVKSSLSYKLNLTQILNICRIATKKSELRDINIQVYFWLTLEPKANENRVTVPSIRQAAIIGWFAQKDLIGFEKYKHEAGREVPVEVLSNSRSMASLLQYLK